MTATAIATSVELLRFSPESPRTAALYAALTATAGRFDMRQTRAYHGGSDLLMLWGPGGPDRFGPMREQQALGGHVIAWDLAYWQRDAKLRVSIDAAHPQAWVMRKDWPDTRLRRDGVVVTDEWNPNGPVIVAGIGRKARVQYGSDKVETWEAEMLREAAARYGRPVQYRRKQADAPVPAGVTLTSDRPIEQVLSGASLVITWHSNVAIDAIRMGIPVVCRDGAAAAVCPSVLGDVHQPLPVAVRDRFLANLAWFQWAPGEASTCWRFLRELLGCE